MTSVSSVVKIDAYRKLLFPPGSLFFSGFSGCSAPSRRAALRGSALNALKATVVQLDTGTRPQTLVSKLFKDFGQRLPAYVQFHLTEVSIRCKVGLISGAYKPFGGAVKQIPGVLRV